MCYCLEGNIGNAHPGYADEGATCSDLIDGDITDRVQVSGDQVQLSRIGTYRVTYQCSNAYGVAAEPIVRTVTIFDDVCPTCAVDSNSVQTTIEASFPYFDDPVSCSDNLPWPSETTLQAKPAHVTGHVNVEVTGTYVLTYSATDYAQNSNFKRANGDACNSALVQVRTVIVQDTLEPVISLRRPVRRLMEEVAPRSCGLWHLVALSAVIVAVFMVLKVARHQHQHFAQIGGGLPVQVRDLPLQGRSCSALPSAVRRADFL